MRRAEEQSLQLVEVNPKTSPPVCKIMDYGKFKYETAKRERDAKKNKKSQELKEVKFRPKTHNHDFGFKVKHARRFLEDNNKVRLLVQFRGREITHPETGRDVLNRVVKEVMDLATVIQMPNMEGNRMSMIIAPKPRRDGGGSKPKPAAPAKAKAAGEADSPAPAAAESPAAGESAGESPAAAAADAGKAPEAPAEGAVPAGDSASDSAEASL